MISIIKLDNMSSIEAVRIQIDKLKTQNNPTINQFVAIPFKKGIFELSNSFC